MSELNFRDAMCCLGGADQALQSDVPGIFVSKAKRDENQLTTSDMGNPDLSGYLDV